MITVQIAGLVIQSANNIVSYVRFFLFRADYLKAYIFSNKILPLIKLMRVYIVGIIFEQRALYVTNNISSLDVVVYSKSLLRPVCNLWCDSVS